MSLFPIFSPGEAAAANVAFVASHVDTSDASVYTYSGVGLGTGKIVVSVSQREAGGGALTGLTVDGNAASFLVEKLADGTTGSGTEIWQYNGNTSAAGDIVVTFGGTRRQCGIGVWLVTDAADAVENTASSAANPNNATISCSAGGVIIGVAQGLGSDSWTWTNLTEVFDEVIDASSGSSHSGASDAFAATQTNRSITADPTATSGIHMCLVSFAPA